MACRFEVTLPGDSPHVAAARRALDEADRLEAALTVFRDTSELTRVNRTAADGPAPVDDELFALLSLCRQLSDETGGAFDITSTPLSRCWGFLQRAGRLPAHDDIDRARTLVGAARVSLDPAGPSVQFATRGMELNLGSIGKGYALDRMAARLHTDRVRDALVSAAGSSVVALGAPDAGWPIDVRSCRVACGRLARVLLDGSGTAAHGLALATSGAGEQFIEVDGVRYGHVLDPRTGWPASGVLSATVITRAAAVADALSTAFLVGGVDFAQQYCAAHHDTLALLVSDDGSKRPVVIGDCRGATVDVCHEGHKRAEYV